MHTRYDDQASRLVMISAGSGNGMAEVGYYV